jgi:YD repeat-containing protein
MLTQIKYPHDLPYVTAHTQLVAENKVNEIVEQTTDMITNFKPLSKQKVEYSIYTGGAVHYAYVSKMQSAVGNASYTDDLVVQQRDNNQNILQAIGKDGTVISFIYGYQNSLPVAKIIGASYSTVSSYVNISSIQSLDGAALRTALAPLRNIPNTLSTINTYIRGIGVSSETNANGLTLYYEYDSLGRLVSIKDHLGNIKKSMEYQYQK